MSTPIADFNGNVLYLDTTTFYLFLRAITPEARKLFQNVERGNYKAYTSVLTFDELVYRMLLAVIRDNYQGMPLEHLRQNQGKVIEEFYPQLDVQIAYLQAYPNLEIVDITSADLTMMRNNVRQHKLRPRDALHLAAMQKVNCYGIVSQDSDFDHVPGVQRYFLG